MDRERTRRTFLATLGSGAAVLAGCSSDGEVLEDAPADPNPSGTDSAIDPVEHDKLVGAHYYSWYWGDDGYADFDRPWLDHAPYTPELGQYDSRDPDIIDQHIKWALEHGINWFIITAGDPGKSWDRTIRNSYLEAELSDQMTFSVQTGFDTGPFKKDTEGMVDVEDPHNRSQIRQFLEHYQDAYFDEPSYLRVDGRPVLFDFSTPTLTGDTAGVFEEAKDAVSADPYLVGNPRAFWVPPTPPIDDLYDSLKQTFEAYDAVHKYAPIPPAGANERRADYLARWKEQTENWLFMTRYHDTGFIPTVMPGFNDTEIKWDGRTHHEAFDLSPEEFADLCATAPDYADPDLDAVIITSWNEFPEGTTIEPTEEYGMDRLETIKQELGTQPADSVAAGDHPLIELAWDHTTSPNSADTRELAFMLTRLNLGIDGDTLRSYDVGTMGEEPHLVAGAYARAQHSSSTGRWLGGPDSRTAFYIHEDAGDATTATFTGYPIDPEIAADVYRDGEHTDHIEMDPEPATYTVSL